MRFCARRDTIGHVLDAFVRPLLAEPVRAGGHPWTPAAARRLLHLAVIFFTV